MSSKDVVKIRVLGVHFEVATKSQTRHVSTHRYVVSENILLVPRLS